VVDYDGMVLCGFKEPANFSDRMYRWPSPDITWGIAAKLPQFAADSFYDACTECFDRWPRVCGVRPRFITDIGRANILVGIQTIGPGGVLADCELPTMGSMDQQCRLRADTAEAWCISDNPPPDKVDFLRTGCHEVGHGLGIGHIAAGNLMAATYSRTIRAPQRDDTYEAVNRYGLPIPPSPDAPPSPTPEYSDAAFAELAKWLEQGARIVAKIGRRP
jgi:hypothetical protein